MPEQRRDAGAQAVTDFLLGITPDKPSDAFNDALLTVRERAQALSRQPMDSLTGRAMESAPRVTLGEATDRPFQVADDYDYGADAAQALYGLAEGALTLPRNLLIAGWETLKGSALPTYGDPRFGGFNIPDLAEQSEALDRGGQAALEAVGLPQMYGAGKWYGDRIISPLIKGATGIDPEAQAYYRDKGTVPMAEPMAPLGPPPQTPTGVYARRGGQIAGNVAVRLAFLKAVRTLPAKVRRGLMNREALRVFREGNPKALADLLAKHDDALAASKEFARLLERTQQGRPMGPGDVKAQLGSRQAGEPLIPSMRGQAPEPLIQPSQFSKLLELPRGATSHPSVAAQTPATGAPSFSGVELAAALGGAGSEAGLTDSQARKQRFEQRNTPDASAAVPPLIGPGALSIADAALLPVGGPFLTGLAQKAYWMGKQALAKREGVPQQRLIARRAYEMTRDYIVNVRAHVAAQRLLTRNILDGKTDDGKMPVMVPDATVRGHTRRAKPLTPEQRQDLIFVIDSGLIEFFEAGGPYAAHAIKATARDGNLFIKGDTIAKLKLRVTTDMLVAGRRIMDANDAFRQSMADTLGAEFPHLARTPEFIREAYLSHIYENVDKLTTAERDAVVSALENEFRTHNPLDMKRTYETFEAAVKASGGKLKPKFDTIEGFIDAHRALHATATFGKVFMQELVELDRTLPFRLVSANPEKGWKQSNHWFWRFYRDIPFVGGRPPNAYVHPELWAYAQSIFGKKFKGAGGAVLNALSEANRIFKRFRTQGPFHFGALFKSVLPSFRGGAVQAGATGVFSMAHAHAALKDPAFIQEATAAGLMVAEIPVTARSSIIKALGELSKSPSRGKRVAGKIVRTVAFAPRFLDWLTWEAGFRHFLVVAYKNGTAEMVRAGVPVEEARRRAAVAANATMGSPDWDNLGTVMRNPVMRQILQSITFAASWSVSTAQQGMGPFASIGAGPPPPPGGAGGPKSLTFAEWKKADTAAKNMAAKWWGKYIAQAVVLSQVANRMATDRDYGKAQWTWENADNRKRYAKSGDPWDLLRIHGGVVERQPGERAGTWSYQFSKQGPEFTGWFTRPLDQAFAKANPLIKLGIELKTGRQLGGTGMPIRPDIFKEPFKGWKAAERAKHALMSQMPFIVRRAHEPKGRIPGIGPTFGLFSVARGVTPGAADWGMRDAYVKFAGSGDVDALVANVARMSDAMKAEGVENLVEPPRGPKQADGVKGKAHFTSPDPVARARGKVWRSELVAWQNWKGAQGEARGGFWKVFATKGKTEARTLVPTLNNLGITRESLRKNLMSKQKLDTARLIGSVGRDDASDLHGHTVLNSDINEALKWFK